MDIIVLSLSLVYYHSMVYYSVAGPIVGALSNKFGLRPVGVAGSILAACAFILSTFSPNISIFQLIYGVIGGN